MCIYVHKVGDYMKRFFKGICKSMKEFFKNNLKYIVGFLVIVFPLLICVFLKLATTHIPGNCFVIEENIQDWFAFFASYSGTAVSCIIGYITYKLTLKLNDLNTENTKWQNKLSIINNIPNMQCENMRLYAISEGDVAYKYITMFERVSNHILKFNMSPAFPPYFYLELKSIRLNLKNSVGGECIKGHKVDLSSSDYIITNNNRFETIIALPDILNEQIQNLYYMKLLTADGTKYDNTHVDMWIEIICHNVLLQKKDEMRDADVKFLIHFVLENAGKKDRDGIELIIINREFMYIDNEEITDLKEVEVKG